MAYLNSADTIITNSVIHFALMASEEDPTSMLLKCLHKFSTVSLLQGIKATRSHVFLA
jgi:hypothetical protein